MSRSAEARRKMEGGSTEKPDSSTIAILGVHILIDSQKEERTIRKQSKEEKGDGKGRTKTKQKEGVNGKIREKEKK